jgi:hypothetical protein
MVEEESNPSSQPKTASSYLREFKGAVALSNAGATLLQRKACHQAEQAMKEALSSMKVFFTHYDQNNEIEGKVHAANKVVASTQSLPNAQCIELSLHDVSYASLREILVAVGSTSSFRPIRVMNCGSRCTMEDAELISSVILFNFSITRRLLALEEADDSPAAIIMLEGSRKLLSLALASLQTQFEQCTDEVYLSLILFVSSLVLNGLERISIELGDYDSAEKHALAIASIRLAASNMLQEYHAFWCTAFDCMTASAA